MATRAMALLFVLGGWSPAAPMPAARHSHAAVLLVDGSVLVTGGYTAAGVSAAALRYVPGSNGWVAAKSMTAARAAHTATFLSNGKVLIAGGAARAEHPWRRPSSTTR